MSRRMRPRKATRLNDSTRRMLESYGLAATAAGVGVLALACPAEAEIIYTPAHVVLKRGSQYGLDLNHDGIVDFTLHNAKQASQSYGGMALIPATGNGAIGFKSIDNWDLASALPAGSVISGRYFPGKLLANSGSSEGGSVFYWGSWVNVKNQYLGFRFKIEGENHFGWARLNVVAADRAITATLTGYAYETIANKPIIAGKTKGGDGTGEPAGDGASLGGLAIGKR
jgi:hypothetical protein